MIIKMDSNTSVSLVIIVSVFAFTVGGMHSCSNVMRTKQVAFMSGLEEVQLTGVTGTRLGRPDPKFVKLVEGETIKPADE